MKVAVIGCGTIANAAHIPSYMKNPEAEIKYFCDIIPERAQAAVEKVDSQRREYYEHFSGKKWGEIDGYDLIVDSSVLGVEGTVNLLAGGFEAVSD